MVVKQEVSWRICIISKCSHAFKNLSLLFRNINIINIIIKKSTCNLMLVSNLKFCRLLKLKLRIYNCAKNEL